MVWHVLTVNPDEDGVKILIEDTQRGNQWARAAFLAYCMAEEYSAQLSKIEIPVRVMVGELNRVETVQNVGAEVVERIVGASMVIVEGSGYLLPIFHWRKRGL